MFIEETLKDCLCEIFKELKIGNFNDERMRGQHFNLIKCENIWKPHMCILPHVLWISQEVFEAIISMNEISMLIWVDDQVTQNVHIMIGHGVVNVYVYE